MRVDEIALREFLHTRYPPLVGAIALVCGSRPAAEDAVQEALLRAWDRSDRGEDIESMNAWVTTVALNLARSSLRRLRSERRAKARLRGSIGGEDPALGAERVVDTERALAKLSPAASGRRSSFATTCSSTRKRWRQRSTSTRAP